MMIDLSSLNANQRNSVNWGYGPLLVLAGPGSGKTRVLTYRIARIIEETSEKHFRILGLTFTNKAAAEMRNRVKSLVPNPGERILLTTFHSFSVNLLRQHGHHIGLRPDFKILSQPLDRESVLDEAVERTKKDYPEVNYRGEQLLPLVAGLLDDCVQAKDAIEVLKVRNVTGADAIGTIYMNYRHLMIKNNYLDFGALIAEAVGLLEEKPAVRKQVNLIYSYFCVDEFQDTNFAQYRILKNIVDRSTNNLFVVADDDQIIYQWNGANPERLKELQRDFQMNVLQLPESYRCPPEVVEVANKLIVNNPSHNSQKANLITNKQSSKESEIRVKSFDSFDEEANWIASDIARSDRESRSRCVILARTRKILERVVDALRDNGMHGYLEVRKDEFTSSPMVWLHAMLRLANARQDRGQLRRVCKAFFDLEGINLIANDIISDSAAEESDYLRAWQRATLRQEQLEPATKRFLVEAVPKLADKLDFWAFIKASFTWFEQISDISSAPEDGLSEYKEEKKTWHQLVDEVTDEFGRDNVSLNVLIQGLDLRAKTQRPPIDSVLCYTIHLSKGMEFDHVYLAGLVEDQLPSWAAINKGDHSKEMQEERRSCFVAITRVQKRLTLTYSQKVFGWTKKPSRFLREMELPI